MGVFQAAVKRILTFSTTFFILVTYSRQIHALGQNGPVDILQLVSSGKSAPVLAAQLAIEDINSIRQEVGSPLKITLSYGETGCDKDTSEAAMYKSLSTGRPKLAVLAGCPTDCETIARGSSFWSTVPICYAMSSPARSDSPFNLNAQYMSNLFLAQPHLSATTPFLIKFVAQFGWKRVGIVYDEDYDKFSEMAGQLALNLNSLEVSLFPLDSNVDGMGTSLPLNLDRIQRENLKIILALVSEDSYREILCEIYNRRLFGPEKYVWVFLGTTGKDFFLKSNLLQPVSAGTPNIGRGRNFVPAFGFREPLEEELSVDIIEDETNIRQVNCKPEELAAAADGHFTAQAVPWDLNDNAKTIGGMTPRIFRTRVLAALQRHGQDRLLQQSEFDEAPLAYDSIWAAYFAINKTLSECEPNCDTSYENRELRSTIEMNLMNLWFEGVSGNFSFHQNRRSVANAGVQMYRYARNKISLIAKYSNSNKTIEWNVADPFQGSIPDDGARDFFPPEEVDPFAPTPSVTQPTPQCNSAVISSLINVFDVLFLLVSLVIIA